MAAVRLKAIGSEKSSTEGQSHWKKNSNSKTLREKKIKLVT